MWLRLSSGRKVGGIVIHHDFIRNFVDFKHSAWILSALRSLEMEIKHFPDRMQNALFI
jgi:hypothetical protein